MNRPLTRAEVPPMMLDMPVCAECGAAIPDRVFCDQHYQCLLAWEAHDTALAAVHHLTVLCYHIQHPSQYSQAGLARAVTLLNAFVAHLPPPDVPALHAPPDKAWRRGTRPPLALLPVVWRVTVGEVVCHGSADACLRVQHWAHCIADDMRHAQR